MCHLLSFQERDSFWQAEYPWFGIKQSGIDAILSNTFSYFENNSEILEDYLVQTRVVTESIY